MQQAARADARTYTCTHTPALAAPPVLVTPGLKVISALSASSLFRDVVQHKLAIWLGFQGSETTAIIASSSSVPPSLIAGLFFSGFGSEQQRSGTPKFPTSSAVHVRILQQSRRPVPLDLCTYTSPFISQRYPTASSRYQRHHRPLCTFLCVRQMIQRHRMHLPQACVSEPLLNW